MRRRHVGRQRKPRRAASGGTRESKSADLRCAISRRSVCARVGRHRRTAGVWRTRRTRNDCRCRRRVDADRREGARHHRNLPSSTNSSQPRLAERCGLPMRTSPASRLTCKALRAAARDGVDVRLLVPGASDIPILRPLSQAGFRPLLEAGIRVFEWKGTMLHAKTAVADGRWARVGSSNLNVASWIGNYELDRSRRERALRRETWNRCISPICRTRPRSCWNHGEGACIWSEYARLGMECATREHTAAAALRRLPRWRTTHRTPALPTGPECERPLRSACRDRLPGNQERHALRAGWLRARR